MMPTQKIDGEEIDYATGQPISQLKLTTQKATPMPLLGTLGLLLFVGGVCSTVYYMQFFNVTVTTQPVSLMGQSFGGGEQINNIGLMQDRQNGIIVGVGITIVASIMLVGDALIRKKP